MEKPDSTRDELAEATSKTVRTIQRILDSLGTKKQVERVGSDKAGYWKIIRISAETVSEFSKKRQQKNKILPGMREHGERVLSA